MIFTPAIIATPESRLFALVPWPRIVMSPDPDLIRTIFSTLLVPKTTADMELDVEFDAGLDVSAVSAAPPPNVMSPPLESIKAQLLIPTPPLAPVVQNVISPPEVEIVLVVEAFVPAEVVMRPADLTNIP